MAWKNQPIDFFSAAISTTLRAFQFVSLNVPDRLNAIHDFVQDLAVPGTRFASAPDAVLRVPAAPVHFPRHLGLAPHLGDVHVFRPLGQQDLRIERPPVLVRTAAQDRPQRLAGITSARLRSHPLTIARLTVARLTVARLTVARLTVARQELLGVSSHLLRRTGCDQPPTILTGLRAHVDAPNRRS